MREFRRMEEGRELYFREDGEAVQILGLCYLARALKDDTCIPRKCPGGA